MQEKTYNDLSPQAKKGLNKFSRMSVHEMHDVGEEFRRKTGMNPNNIYNKELFFKFVANYKVKKIPSYGTDPFDMVMVLDETKNLNKKGLKKRRSWKRRGLL